MLIVWKCDAPFFHYSNEIKLNKYTDLKRLSKLLAKAFNQLQTWWGFLNATNHLLSSFCGKILQISSMYLKPGKDYYWVLASIPQSFQTQKVPLYPVLIVFQFNKPKLTGLLGFPPSLWHCYFNRLTLSTPNYFSCAFNSSEWLLDINAVVLSTETIFWNPL